VSKWTLIALRPIDADLQVPNIAKFQTHTGWKPEIPTTRPCVTCWTIGGIAWQRRGTASSPVDRQ